MDGAFLDLDAENVDGEVDEFSREIYKIQKVFNQKLKKMQMEVDEVNRERKKRRRLAEEGDGEVNPEDQDMVLQVPQGFNICNSVMDQTKDFKVRSCTIVLKRIFVHCYQSDCFSSYQKHC